MVERFIGTGFYRVKGGYRQKITDTVTPGVSCAWFIPDSSVSRYDEKTGELWGHAPDYEKMEEEKKPAVTADKPGEYSYYYEMQKPPIGCDYKAERSYYGEHYYLYALRGDLPRLKGRGITYDEKYKSYTVTRKAYEKIKAEYRISFEMCFD